MKSKTNTKIYFKKVDPATLHAPKMTAATAAKPSPKLAEEAPIEKTKVEPKTGPVPYKGTASAMLLFLYLNAP